MPSTDMATERGRFNVKRLIVVVLTPAVVALGALVAVAAPASAAPVDSIRTGSALGSASTVAPVDTTSPAPTITISGGATAFSNLASPTISGTSTGAAGHKVVVYVAGLTLTGTISPTGDWSVVSNMVEGRHQAVAAVWASSGLRVTSSQILTVDRTAPVIGINGGPAASTRTATPTINGRVDLPAGSNIGVVVDEVTHEVAVSSTRTWSLTVPRLAAGAHTVVVSATDAAGNVATAQQRLTVVPVLSIDGGASRLTNDPTPTISGTTDAPVGTPVAVTGLRQTLTGTVTAAGVWSVTARSVPSDVYSVLASVRDAAGNVRTAPQSLTVDTMGPVIVIDGGSAMLTQSATPTISGRINLNPDNAEKPSVVYSMPAGSSISVVVDGVARTTVLSSDTTWSVTSPSLGVGGHIVVVSATDPAGNVGTQYQRITVVPTLSIDGGASRLTNDATPTISGTTNAPSGTTVTVTVGGQTLIGTVTAPGVWSVTASSLPSTGYSVLARVRDAARNVSAAGQSLTIDTVAPAIVIDGGSAASTQSATPTISGRVDLPAGSSVSVVVDGVAHEVVVSSTRTWSVTAPQLTAGAHTVDVSATDAAGNVGTGQQRLTVVPVLSIDGGAARLTNDANPTISGTTDAPVGTPVTVAVAGQTLTGTVTAPGTWSVTPHSLPSAVHQVKAAVRDSVGNVRTAWQNLTVDTVAPSIVIDGGSSVSTKTATPTISGRVDVPAGSKIKIVVDEVAQEVVVSSTRTWSVTSPSLATGAHTVVVSATDAAGNVGTQRQRLTVIG